MKREAALLDWPQPRIVVLISHLRRPLQASHLAQVVNATLEEYRHQADVRVLDTAVLDALDEARALEQRGEVDVFVCAGATAAYLRRHLARPVLSMRVGGADLLRALEQARGLSSEVAVVSYQRINAELDDMAGLFTVRLHQAAYTSLEEARSAVREMAGRGCRALIGSSTVLELAEEIGLQGVLAISSDTVRKALDDALAVLHSQRLEEAKQRHLNAVLRHVPLGVAAVDVQGNVQSLNPPLAQLLEVSPEQALGRPLQGLLPGLDVDEALRSPSGEESRVLRIGTHTVVGSILPIVEGDRRTGMVFTCQEISAVQRADRRIRSTARPGRFTARYRLSQLDGSSLASRELLRLAERYAATDSTVLITGESGTGKELLAQGLHNASHRRNGPFVAINCAAFPETLLESELFGHEEGAFSGARKGGKAGLFEAGHHGTVFLDEVGDMPLSLQTRLLRVLQEREVLRLGATEPTAIDVRVIAATHQDLRGAIEAGRFRKDLYYRLNILRLQTTPLRERIEDIPGLVHGVLARLRPQGLSGEDERRLFDLLSSRLHGHDWPGNVRELENIVERALLSIDDLLQGGGLNEARLAMLLPELSGGAAPVAIAADTDLKAYGKAAESAHARRIVEACGGNLDRAAKQLGVSRSTLWRRLRP